MVWVGVENQDQMRFCLDIAAIPPSPKSNIVLQEDHPLRSCGMDNLMRLHGDQGHEKHRRRLLREQCIQHESHVHICDRHMSKALYKEHTPSDGARSFPHLPNLLAASHLPGSQL